MQLCVNGNSSDITNLHLMIEQLREENDRLKLELNNKIMSEMETDELISTLQEENKKLNAIIKFADTKINHILGSGKGEKINMLV